MIVDASTDTVVSGPDLNAVKTYSGSRWADLQAVFACARAVKENDLRSLRFETQHLTIEVKR